MPRARRRSFTFALASILAAGCGESPPAAPADAGVADVGRRDTGVIVDDVPALPTPAYDPPAAVLRRLTRSQYANIVRDVFGDDVVAPRSLEPDVAREGFFAVGASETTVSPRGVEQYQTAAFDLAEQVLRNPTRRARVLTCQPMGVTDDACAGRFVTTLGRRLWRRALTAAETARWVEIARRGATALNDFHRGLEYAMAGLLQSPDFVFRVELGEPDPGRAGSTRYTGWEMASRLSFMLWDSAPDDELLSAAESGALVTDAGVAQQADRMLASPKARRGLRAFVTEWLQLYRLDDVSKDAMIFPSFGPDIGGYAREETLRVAEAMVFDSDRDFRDILTTRETWVNRRLASFYAVQFPVRDAPAGLFVQVTLPENQPRRGLLGQMSVLALQSHPVSTSPTLRGKFIREAILCNDIPMPPVDVNTAIPEPSPQLRTLRERLMEHQRNRTCAGCHGLMDPLGLTMESFDGVGRFRSMDNGVPLITEGVLDEVRFRDLAELSEALHEHPAVPRCMTTLLYHFAQGRVETSGEEGEVERLLRAFRSRGYRMRALLREMAVSDSFRRTGTRRDP